MKSPLGIRFESVSKHYSTQAGLVRALDDIDLDVEPGTSLAVTGPSGSGKSTLLGLIGGLESPSSGRVFVGEHEIPVLSDEKRTRLRRDEFGFIFQRDNLQPFLTAIENVALALALHEDNDSYERCLQVLSGLGLSDEVGKFPDRLSGGQRQRVAVARAVINRPGVILADEPTGSLDAANSAAVIDLLLESQKQVGATLMVVTHDSEVADRLDRTISLRGGHLLESEMSHPLPKGSRSDV